MSIFNADYLLFFQELAQNNNKEWFDLNRSRYEDNVKVPFRAFTQLAIDAMAMEDAAFSDLLAKDCVFRINRDVRFSKDKNPYKLMCSALIAPNGKKSKASNGIYFEFSPEHVRFYGGVYEIDKEDMYAVREGIIQNPREFSSLIEAKAFKSVFGKIHGEKNKILPAEFKNAAIEEPLIFNKQWYFFVEYPASDLLKSNLLDQLIRAYLTARPLELFFDQFIQQR